MTLQELEALPVFVPFWQEVHEVQPDGTVTLPDGRVLSGLRGRSVSIPRPNPVLVTPMDQFAVWRDEQGQWWQTVNTPDGLKRAWR